MADLRAEIEKQNATFAKHFAANDMETLKNLYTEDCKVMPEGSDTLIGNQAVPHFFGELIKGGATTANLVTDEVGPLGGTNDVVFERGQYKFCKADGSNLGVGKYVVIWKKTSEGYKLYIDIFNSN